MKIIALLLVPVVLVHPLPRTNPPDCSSPAKGQQVRADFVTGRVFARWPVPGHDALYMYTDTGGGLLSFYPSTAQSLGLHVDTLPWTNGEYHGIVRTMKVEGSLADSLLPPVPSRDSAFVTFVIQDGEDPPVEQAGFAWSGRLGTDWFADRVWTFDYPNHKLIFNGSAPTGPSAPECWVPLGFQVDSAGRRVNSFPRITALIDGDSVQMLLDTGARTEPTAHARTILGPDESNIRATSFIIKDRFDRWRERHPDWLMISQAEEGTGFAMIRVPSIQVGGQKIGPVWFTERPNKNFRNFMSQYMDKPIEGALGGSAWRNVTLILDYPRARASVSGEVAK